MQPLTRLFIVRHGHVEGIAPERFRGRTDVELTSEGRAQADAVARRIAGGPRPAAIYTSPLRRCIVTGAAISRACNAGAKVLESLVDLDYGAWQWKTPDEVRARWPQLLELWYEAPDLVRFPAGESLQDAAVRAADALRYALEVHAGQTVVLVTHDAMIRVMLSQLIGLPLAAYRRFAQDPGALNDVTIAGGTVCVERLNVT